jgi:RNA polymerase sigma-70 factor (ECF subfamily)
MDLLPDTRYSLLARLVEPADAAAWSEFQQVYEETILRYSLSHGLQEADAQDVVQQVLLAVHGVVSEWKPSGRQGSFRTWLIRTSHRICLRALRDRRNKDRAVGGSSAYERLQGLVGRNETELVDETEWRKWAFCLAAGQVRRAVETATWHAFWQTAVEGKDPAEVAQRLGLSVGSVYAAKCRVLARIRARVQDLSRSEL